VTKLVFVLAGALLLETLLVPVQVRADGDPGPSCPTHQVCKP
jgi:hypothetical protein